jgi:FixJ family two-component response regulator
MADRTPIVFMLDDDEAIGIALGRLLRANGFQTRIYTSALKFLEAHDGDTPGCLVTDLRMPGMSGLELQSALLARGIERPIVFITGQGDIPTTVQAMKAGAVTFLSKPLQRTEFLAAVREAIARDAEARTRRHEQHEVSGRLASLTARERQVLDLVATGLLNKQIAAELGAAEKTIKVHRGRIMEKMQVRTATELVSLLFRTESYVRTSGDSFRRPVLPNYPNAPRLPRLNTERSPPPVNDTNREVGAEPPTS